MCGHRWEVVISKKSLLRNPHSADICFYYLLRGTHIIHTQTERSPMPLKMNLADLHMQPPTQGAHAPRLPWVHTHCITSASCMWDVNSSPQEEEAEASLITLNKASPTLFSASREPSLHKNTGKLPGVLPSVYLPPLPLHHPPTPTRLPKVSLSLAPPLLPMKVPLHRPLAR